MLIFSQPNFSSLVRLIVNILMKLSQLERVERQIVARRRHISCSIMYAFELAKTNMGEKIGKQSLGTLQKQHGEMKDRLKVCNLAILRRLNGRVMNGFKACIY